MRELAAFALRSFSTCLHKRTRRKLRLPSGGSTMNLFHPQIAAALVATISLAAGIALPAAPTIPVARGPSKTLEMFGADQAACQQNAAAQLSPAVAAANNQAVGGALLGGALGAGLGAGIGAAAGNAGRGAAIGAASGGALGIIGERGWRALSAGVAAAAVRYHVRAVHGRPRELCRQPLPAPRRRALFRKILDLLWRPLALITATLHPHGRSAVRRLMEFTSDPSSIGCRFRV